MPDEYEKLLTGYLERFNDSPPIFMFKDEQDGIRIMRMGLERGKPVTEKELGLPDDVLL